MTDLSICFAAYNQADMLHRNLDAIAAYPGDNFEVVVSDDCSTEDIRALVNQYDERFRYTRTPHNLGHDGNILHGISQCKSDYVMLMRTRDNVVPDAIPHIIACIRSHPDAGYFLFSAYDEQGEERLRLPNQIYEVGEQTVSAQSKLLIHPSGGIYNKRYLRLKLYDAYASSYFDHKFGFVVHQLMRADASVRGAFVTQSRFGWTYAQTLKATDIAENSTQNRLSVHAPEYVHERYVCEFDFARFEISNPLRKGHLVGVVQRYYEFLLYHLPIILTSKQYAYHYNSDTQSYDVVREMATLHELTSHLSGGLDSSTHQAILQMEKREFIKARTLYPSIRMARGALDRYAPLDSAYRAALKLCQRA